MNNLTTLTPSMDEVIRAASVDGQWRTFYAAAPTTPTAATTASGGIIARRYPRTITVPSVGAGFSGYVTTMFDIITNCQDLITLGGLEYDLGTLTVSGNSFADGSAMPTKTVRGESLQTASQCAFLVATAALTATTPAITITYVNQAGTGSRTATLTLPTNAAINTTFYINPHLQSGDTGIRDVTNISTSAGSAGTLKVFGVLTQGVALNCNSNAGLHSCIDPLQVPWPNYLMQSGEGIAFYTLGSAAVAADIIAAIAAVPE